MFIFSTKSSNLCACSLIHQLLISLFRDSDFEDLATGPLLSLGPMCGTLFRPKSDNRVTIFYSSRVNWKHFCSSSPEPFCGSIFNEGSYKYSILLLGTTGLGSFVGLGSSVGWAPAGLTLCVLKRSVRHTNTPPSHAAAADPRWPPPSPNSLKGAPNAVAAEPLRR